MSEPLSQPRGPLYIHLGKSATALMLSFLKSSTMLQKQIIISSMPRSEFFTVLTKQISPWPTPSLTVLQDHLGEEYLTVWLTEFFLSNFNDVIRKAQMTWLFEKACSFPLCWHLCSSPSHHICVRDLLHLCWKKGLSEIWKWKLSQGPTLILKTTQLPQTPSHRLLKNVVVCSDLPPPTSRDWQIVCQEIPSPYKACFF